MVFLHHIVVRCVFISPNKTRCILCAAVNTRMLNRKMCASYQRSLSFILPLKSNSSGSSLLLESDPSLGVSLSLGDPKSCKVKRR